MDRHQSTRDQRGAAALEFALVIPFLLLVLLGMIGTGLALSDDLSATNAVREGSRYGASADITSTAWATSVRDRVKQVYFNSGRAITDDQICVRLVRADGTTLTQVLGAQCGSAPTLPSNMTASSCAVLVWMQQPETVHLVVAPSLRFNVGATSVAYYGRKVGTCTAA